jgi:hypothetical protein
MAIKKYETDPYVHMSVVITGRSHKGEMGTIKATQERDGQLWCYVIPESPHRAPVHVPADLLLER